MNQGWSKRVDFSRSSIRWLTKNGSYGSFNIEAVIRIYPKGSNQFISYALGAPVLAGNMYSEEILNKSPPYLFQVAAGVSDHVIFRSDMLGGWLSRSYKILHSKSIKDSCGQNDQLFQILELNLCAKSAIETASYGDISKYYFEGWQFSSLICIDADCGYRIELEFPVKHLNISPRQKMWQLETGPILYLKRDQHLSRFDKISHELLPYFIHANNSEYADFSPNFPITRSMDYRSIAKITKRVKCRIKLFTFNV
jgi:hypothetical protein